MLNNQKVNFNVKAQLLHLICKNSLDVMLPTFSISVVFFVMFFVVLSGDERNATFLNLRWNLLAWFIVSIGIELSRYYFVRFYLKENRRPVRSKKEFEYWSNRLTLFYFLSGLRWAYIAYTLFFPEYVLLQGTIFIILFGTMTGMIYTTSMLPQAFYAYSVPIMVGVTATIFHHVFHSHSPHEFLSGDTVFCLHVFHSHSPSEFLLGATGFCLFTYVLYGLVTRILYHARRGNIEAINLKLENKTLIKKLRNKNERQTLFLAVASHDLRQPVQALELLVNHLSSTQRRENITIDKIQQSTTALNSLLDSLLDISKLDANAMKFMKCPVSISMLFSQMKKDFNEKAKNKGLSLIVNPIDKNIDTDPDLIFRILSNLLDNAVKYTDQGGVTLSATSIDGMVCIQVADTGIGIPSDKQNTVFEEFKQLDNPENDRSKGIGLGLSICSRMSKLLSHKMKLSSQKGEGTTVDVFVCETLDMPIKKEVQPIDDIDLSGKRAFVIENEKDIRYALSLTLDNLGAKVLEAGSRSVAQLIIGHVKDRIDFIICDYRLDDSDENDNGVKLLNDIRAALNYEVPAIILTGNMHYKDIQLGNNMQLLVKPASADKLKWAIGVALRT